MTMFKSFFAKDERSSMPSIPAGYRVYAVGDVHGRLDLLEQALAHVEQDRRARRRADDILVFLGDLIDRGPASAQVVERLRTYRRPGLRIVFLSGNHEEVLLRILAGHSEFVPDWLRFGGVECADSYGIKSSSLRSMSPEAAAAVLRGAVPSGHRDFLESFADTFRIGSYLFVHAGIRPGLALEEQSQSDLRWIRKGFLDSADDHGFVIVHGHTITQDVDVQANRVGIDTGAYRTGQLTVMGLEGSQRWFFQTADKLGAEGSC